MPTITLASRRVRAGTFQAERNLTAGLAGNCGIALDISEPDLSDPGKTALLSIERSTDGGASWLMWAASSWQGGPATKPGASRQPAVGGEASELAGQRVRVTVTLGASLDTGLVLTLP